MESIYDLEANFIISDHIVITSHDMIINNLINNIIKHIAAKSAVTLKRFEQIKLFHLERKETNFCNYLNL